MGVQNLKKSLKPYYMSILSVFISVVSLCIVSLISMVGKYSVDRELDGMGINGMTVTAYAPSGENITDEKIYNVLSESEKISRLTPVLYQNASLIFNNGKEINCISWGISSMAEDIVNLDQLYGRGIAQYDIDNNSYVCMVDENIALESYGRSNITGKKLYLVLNGKINEFEVIGTVNKTSGILNSMSGQTLPDFVYIPYSVQLNLCGLDNFQQIIINVNDSETDEIQIGRYLDMNLQLPVNSRIDIANLSRQRESINRIVDIAFMALFYVSCVAVVVCGVSIAASVNAAVSSSRHDIGIKISLGASKYDIMQEFVLHSLLSCIIGIIVGILTSFVALAGFNIVLGTAYHFDYRLIMYGSSATILLAIIFSLYPSYKAASLIPIKALSRE